LKKENDMSNFLDSEGLGLFWNKIKATFAPKIHSHNYAGASSPGGTATKAVQDSAGQQIDKTYIKGLSASGKTITYTKGNGDTGTITTQDTIYTNMAGATSSAAGKSGLVPAPAAGKQGAFLRGDGTWATPTNTTYNVATTSTNGLMSNTDKKKLDGIAAIGADFINGLS